FVRRRTHHEENRRNPDGRAFRRRHRFRVRPGRRSGPGRQAEGGEEGGEEGRQGREEGRQEGKEGCEEGRRKEGLSPFRTRRPTPRRQKGGSSRLFVFEMQHCVSRCLGARANRYNPVRLRTATASPSSVPFPPHGEPSP